MTAFYSLTLALIAAGMVNSCGSKETAPTQETPSQAYVSIKPVTDILVAEDQKSLAREHEQLPEYVVVQVPLDDQGRENLDKASVIPTGSLESVLPDRRSPPAPVAKDLEGYAQIGQRVYDSRNDRRYDTEFNPIQGGRMSGPMQQPTMHQPLPGAARIGQDGNNIYSFGTIENSNVIIGGHATSGYGPAYAGPRDSALYQNGWAPRTHSATFAHAGYGGIGWQYIPYQGCYFRSRTMAFYTYRRPCYGWATTCWRGGF